MRSEHNWQGAILSAINSESPHALAEIIRAIQRDALASACNAIARIDRATLSLKAGEFELQGWRDAKAALAVAENTVRALIPPTTAGGEGV